MEFYWKNSDLAHELQEVRFYDVDPSYEVAYALELCKVHNWIGS